MEVTVSRNSIPEVSYSQTIGANFALQRQPQHAQQALRMVRLAAEHLSNTAEHPSNTANTGEHLGNNDALRDTNSDQSLYLSLSHFIKFRIKLDMKRDQA